MRLRVCAAAILLAVTLSPGPAEAHVAESAAAVPGTAWWTDPATGARMVSADDSVSAADLRRLAATGATVLREPGVRRQRIAGGDALLTGGGARCTLGFNARTRTPVGGVHTYYFVLAGHCVGPVGSTVSHAGTVLGVVTSVNTARDLALVRYTDTTLPKPSAVNRYTGTLQPITAFASPYVGQSVSRSGGTTGLRGGLVQALNVTVHYSGGVVTGLVRTSACAEPGDSGGPFFAGSNGLGVTSGGSGNCTVGGTTYFAPVAQAFAAWGLTAY